jgi:hypothetical protein
MVEVILSTFLSDLESNYSNIDLQQLQAIYFQAINQIKEIQKTFENLVDYHNQMVTEKVKFITKELPALDNKISKVLHTLNELLNEEKNTNK